jgi:glycosyltransferase involved in cell wall biosynthesis
MQAELDCQKYNKLAYFVDEIRTSFVINDIKRIAEKIDTIYLFSVNKLEGKEALPENVIVYDGFIDWQNFKPIKIVLKNFFAILEIYINECIALKKILPFKKSIALLASNIFKAECVMNKLNTIDPPSSNTAVSLTPPAVLREPLPLHPNSSSLIGYSFWFYDCIYLAWMRKKGWIGKAITRAHGGDLFEERGSLSGKVLFRNFQFNNLDKILSVSQTGSNYLLNKYPKFQRKIETIYLGSPKHEFSNPINTNNRFVMVSCANIRDIKRIHKIAEMLQYVDFPLTWYHIGDENLESKNDPTIPIYIENKKKLQNQYNVKYIVKGNLSNEEILQFYKETPIDLFISLSEAEGVPVSMMEAISFGIPILSTDVGGCKEIVTENTGVLIPLQTEVNEVARIIAEFKDSPKNTAEFRNGVRANWGKYFDEDKNYTLYFKYICL